MFQFILATDNLPFTIALTVMLGIALLEGVGSLLGLGFLAMLDDLFPGVDIDVPDEVHLPSLFSTFLGWLRAGTVPLLILMLVLLTGFGLSGLIIQAAFFSMTGYYIPWFILVIPVFILVLPFVRACSKVFSRFLMKDETSAVSESSFIGQVATITTGSAKRNLPAEAKFHDRFGQVHYVMVEPDEDSETMASGELVLIVKRTGVNFRVIRAPENILSK